ncbi:hypothetical protein ADIARSV_1432 [Arcticibacter svalbardensis MN12-7]|uniref:RDD domain-containing protein n=1 Tax=Arcticibacter svalbardensis MN12-7 TaxID=1150600 RepID=R9GUM3_9SPHI|nr:RDD family protein [Arcticibacter svalbardensis]EOR95431.1 hypothetical protein ADIARSV_1432 [Arcticibacter svalbardensis MN12-7]
MPTVRIITSQNIDIDYDIASLSQRIAARSVDYMVFMCAYTVAFMIFLAYAGISQNEIGRNGNIDQGMFIILIGIWLALCVFYDLFTEMFLNGQSLGKRALKIKVISLNGGRPSIGQYLLRWVFRIIDFGVTLGSAAVVSVAFSDKKQRIGDMIAGTTLVKTTPHDDFTSLIFIQPGLDYKPTYPEVMQLIDKDIVLIHDIIRNFNQTRNNLLIFKLAHRIKTFLNVAYPSQTNDYQFLEIILNDYNYLSAGRA